MGRLILIQESVRLKMTDCRVSIVSPELQISKSQVLIDHLPYAIDGPFLRQYSYHG